MFCSIHFFGINVLLYSTLGRENTRLNKNQFHTHYWEYGDKAPNDKYKKNY
jgi:hypothetical protein